MEVNIFFEDVTVPGLNSEFFVEWFQKVCMKETKVLGSVNVILCSDDYLLELNSSHLQHDYYTDIITFDYTVENEVSGDLFISWDRVVDNAQSFKVDVLDEFHRVCVHGLLHLCGYKDKTESEEVLMRKKEDESLLLR